MQIQPLLYDLLANSHNQSVNPMLDDIYSNKQLLEDTIQYLSDFKSNLTPKDRLQLWTILTHYFGMFMIEHPVFLEFVAQLQYFKDILSKENQLQIGQLIDIVVCKSKPLHEVDPHLVKLVNLKPAFDSLKFKQGQFDRLYILLKHSLKLLEYFFQNIKANQPYFSNKQPDQYLLLLEALRKLHREQTLSEGFTQSLQMQNSLSFIEHFDPLPQSPQDLLKIVDIFFENYVSVTSTLEKDLRQAFKKDLWTQILKQAINFKIELEQYKSVRTKPINEKSSFFHDERMVDLRGEMIEFQKAKFPLDFKSKNALRQTICAMANFKGGFIFLGINESGIVKGSQMNKLEHQILTRDIESLKRQVQPQVKTEIVFIPVRKNDNAGAIFTCTFVCRICVFQGNSGIMHSCVEQDQDGRFDEYQPKFMVRNGMENTQLKIAQIYSYQQVRVSNYEHQQLPRALPQGFSYLEEVYFMNFNLEKRADLLQYLGKTIEYLQIGESNIQDQRFNNVIRVFLLPNCSQILTEYLLNQRQHFVNFGCFIQWGEIESLRILFSPISVSSEELIREKFNSYKFSWFNNQLFADLNSQEEFLRFYEALMNFKNQFNKECKEKEKFWLDPNLRNRL